MVASLPGDIAQSSGDANETDLDYLLGTGDQSLGLPRLVSNVLTASGRASLARMRAVLAPPSALPPILSHETVDGSAAAEAGEPTTEGADIACDGGNISFSAWNADAAVERASSVPGEGGAAPGASAFSGVWGFSSDPGVLLAPQGLTLPLLGTVLSNGAEPALLSLLAFGTLPVLRTPPPAPPMAFGAPPVTLALSAAPHGGSVLVASLANGGTDFRALQLSLVRTPSLPRLGEGLHLYTSLACVADAALRHAARGAAFAHCEWAAAMTALTRPFALLEEELPRFETRPARFASLAAASRAYYSSSPVPLATAELWRTLTVGASSGALQHWAEVSSGGEAGLGKAWKAVEAGCASVEQLLVGHIAPAAEAALLAADELRRAMDRASPGPSGEGYGLPGLGLPCSPQVDGIVRDATRLLRLAEAVRCGVALARSTYGALFVWLRLLVRHFACDVGDDLNTTSAGQAPEEAAKRRAARVPHPQPEEMALVQAALQPAGAPMEAASTGPSAPSASAASDPLGLGFSSALEASASDPLGLGFSSSLDACAAAPEDPLGLGFASSLDGTATGAAVSGGMPRATAVPTAPASRRCDPFLPLSLSALLGTSDDAADLRVLAATPMAGYGLGPSAKVLAGRAQGQASLPRCVYSLASQLHALVGTVCETVSTVDRNTAHIVSVPLAACPSDEGGGGFNPMAMAAMMAGGSGSDAPAPTVSDRLHASVCGRACVTWYDDGADWAWPAGEEAEGLAPVPTGAFGSHMAVIPISPELTPASEALPAYEDGAPPSAVLVLRAAGTGYPDELPASGGSDAAALSACLITLPSSQRLLTGAYYGPAPGAVAAAVAAARASGGSYASEPTIASADNRQLTVVLGALSASDEPSDGCAVTVAQLAYRDLTMAPVPAQVLAAAASDVTFLLEHLASAGAIARMGQAAPRRRDLGAASASARASLQGYAAACSAVCIDASGPRGCAALTLGGARVVALDMEDDSELEEAAAVAEAQDAGSMDVDETLQ